MPDVEVGAVAGLVVETRGEGPRLAMLHGNGEDARCFDQMLPHLAGFRTVVPEARGHGRTPAGARPLTIAEMASDLANLLDEVGDAIVLGFSDGANVAMELAARRLDHLRGLVLVGGNLSPRGLRWREQVVQPVAWAAQRAAGAVSARARAKADLRGLMVFEPRINPAALARVAVPTLVVAGERDVIRTSHTRLIARSIPGAELVIVPRQGHMLPTKVPEELASLVKGFARGLASTT